MEHLKILESFSNIAPYGLVTLTLNSPNHILGESDICIDALATNGKVSDEEQ